MNRREKGMGKKKRLRTKFFHLILALILLVSSLGSNITLLEVNAQNSVSSGNTVYDIDPLNEGSDYVYYVGGEDAAEGNDGSSVEKAMPTIRAAYDSFADKLTDSDTATIVICGEVAAHNDAYATNGGDQTAYEGYYFPEHKGKVIITSTDGTTSYADSASLKFENKVYYLRGDTTFKNIKIGSNAKRVFMNYYPLHLAKDITGTAFSTEVFLGTRKALTNSGVTVTAKDALFTMDSSSVTSLYGGGAYNNPSGVEAFTVTLYINDGKITNLYGTGKA